MANIHRDILLLAFGTYGITGVAQAQTLPDAGALRQQIEQGRETAPPQLTQPAKPLAPPPLSSLKGVVVNVTAFQFSGNTLISSEPLQSAVADFLHRPLDYAQLQAAAAAVADLYRRAGWIVRAYFPEQDIANGAVTIQIVEAVYGGAKVEGAGPQRVSLAHIQSILDAHQKVGEVLNADAVDRALFVAGELPGVGINGTLAEGTHPGETNLVLRFTDELPIRGNVIGDNSGSRSTGTSRVSAEIYLNSILGLGDQFSGNIIASEGSNYLRVGATLPVGNDGWRVGTNASAFTYRLIAPEFTALDATGSSNSGGLEANYPLVRSRLRNLYFNANADRKSYDNRSGSNVTSHYRSNTLTLGLLGNLVDTLGGGGTNNGSLALTRGELDLAGSPNQVADAASTRTEGGFNKLRYSFSRLQVLSNAWSLYLSYSGQWADKNLDSSEKFYLGGANGVRAYPSNEAGGAMGQLINLELRRNLSNGISLSGFYDFGEVAMNRYNNFTGAPTQNEILLRGAGLALSWQVYPNVNLKGTWAQRMGDNPNRTANGNDQDGSHFFDRFWLYASVTF